VRARFALSFVLFAACGRGAQGAGHGDDDARAHRVVTLAPSLTEIAFALGRGDRVIGVDGFSQYPAEATRLPRVGGLVDPSFEGVLALDPDLVLLSSAAGRFDQRLRTAGVRARVLRCESLADLHENVAVLGRLLEAEPAAHALQERIERELSEVRRRAAKQPPPRVLYVFDRQPGAIRDVFAAGKRSFLHELLAIAGGENVLAGEDHGAVSVSHETLLASGAEVIFDATADPAGLAPWRALVTLPAVRTGRIVAADDPVFTIPGPRVGAVARRMARVLHPEAAP
jgi:iron complex transport system substrate-binding protein